MAIGCKKEKNIMSDEVKLKALSMIGYIYDDNSNRWNYETRLEIIREIRALVGEDE